MLHCTYAPSLVKYLCSAKHWVRMPCGLQSHIVEYLGMASSECLNDPSDDSPVTHAPLEIAYNLMLDPNSKCG